jgi:PII-like signaling protein
MIFSENAKRLRIMVCEHDHVGPRPLYEAIVLKAKELGLSGATVYRGMMGFGSRNHLHRKEVFRFSTDQPVVVELTDPEGLIERILPFVEEFVSGGLITIEDVTIVRKCCHSPDLVSAN